MGISLRTLTPKIIRQNEAAILAVAADVPREYWTIENFLYPLPRKWELSFAAWDDGDLIGYAIVSDKSPPHLHHFMVRKDRRNSGLGGRMMAEVLRRTGPRLTLKVAADNEDAVRFYVRHGFGETERANGYVHMRR